MSKWDERYLTDEYVFGTQPNTFIAEILPLLPKGGRALDLATGEGRNGIFLAENGFEAEGVDMSAVGLQKAQRLAESKGVPFQTRQADLSTIPWPSEYYAVITSVFCHFTEPQRTEIMQKMLTSLQPGGMFAGVFYHPEQITLGTGGPSDPAMLGTLEEMQKALNGLQWRIAEHRVHDLAEGSRHQGKSSVIYLLGQKPQA